MKVAYDDLAVLTETYNTLLQENHFDVLCYVSGETMFTKEAVFEEDKNTEAFYQYFQGNSFIVDIVKAAKKYNVPISKLIERFVKDFFEKINIEKGVPEFCALFSKLHFVSAKQEWFAGQQSAILLLNQLNNRLEQWGYGLYAYMDEQKLAELEVCQIPSCEAVFVQLEKLAEQTAKEKQIPLMYARVYCCKTRWQELGMPACIELREYQNTFFKKNIKYLTVSLTRFMLSQGAKCYFEYSEYKTEDLSYDAAELYHWLMATGKKMREIPKGKMTFWFSYQTYLDESKDSLLSVLRLEPNVFGSAKYYMEQNEADYRFILKVLKEMKQAATASQEASDAFVVSPEREESADLQEETVVLPKEEMQAAEDKYGKVLQNIQDKLDDVLNAVIENSVITMDGLEQVNTTVETVNSGVQGVAKNLEETKAGFLARFDELQRRLEQCVENKDTEGLCELLEKKMNLIKQVQQKEYSDVIVGEDVYFLLAFLHTEKPEQVIKELFSYLKNGEYKTKYEEKISENNAVIYSAECSLGKVIVYRRDGVTYLKHLQIKQEYLQEGFVAFFEKYGVKTKAKVFFDNQIYEELERLMKDTKKSFHMIMPWVKDLRLDAYETRLGRMIQSGMEVHIKYGYLSKGSDEVQNRINEKKLAESRKALETLNKKLHEKFGGQIQLKEDDTHIKAAVADGTWCFVGSCNILSFNYDYHKNPDYRHEMMVLLEDEELAGVLMKYCEGTIHDVK